MKGTAVWGWADCRDAETWSGPFDSRQEAIDNALIEADGSSFVVAPGSYPSCEDFAASELNIEELLERMSERASDDGFFGEDSVFSIPDAKKTEAWAALDAAIRSWAAAWVQARYFTVDGDAAEEIAVPAESIPEGAA